MGSDALKAAARIASQRQESIRRPAMTAETDAEFVNQMKEENRNERIHCEI